ncbi:MAG: lipoprotein [Polaromonas sp.]|nr:lipoprotein [Polaromonas sp.]MDP3751246.1 lipoprotein [Polaromonas sp.]
MSLRILGRSANISCLRGLSGLALAAIGAVGLASLAGCGQKGPLFLPPPPRVPATGQAAGAPARPASAPASSATTGNLPEPPPASGPAILLPR